MGQSKPQFKSKALSVVTINSPLSFFFFQGFFCNTEEDFNNWCQQIRKVCVYITKKGTQEYKLLSCFQTAAQRPCSL